MNEREQVIRGLKCCREMDNPAGLRVGGCYDCPYEPKKGKEGCAKALKDDAISLLEAMQPVKPEKHFLDIGMVWYTCGNCGHQIFRGIRAKYCDKCGQAVKWDG